MNRSIDDCNLWIQSLFCLIPLGCRALHTMCSVSYQWASFGAHCRLLFFHKINLTSNIVISTDIWHIKRQFYIRSVFFAADYVTPNQYLHWHLCSSNYILSAYLIQCSSRITCFCICVFCLIPDLQQAQGFSKEGAPERISSIDERTCKRDAVSGAQCTQEAEAGLTFEKLSLNCLCSELTNAARKNMYLLI